MKCSYFNLFIIFCLITSCKRDDAISTIKSYQDLSKGGNLYTGHWVYATLELDSIDIYGKPYFNKNLYTPFGDFTLTSINDSHTFYQRINDFEINGSGAELYYIDSCRLNSITDSIFLIIYNNYSTINTPNKPDSMGLFTGKYDAASNTIKGYSTIAHGYRPKPGDYRLWYGLVYSELQ